MNSHQLKELQTRLTKAKAYLESVKAEKEIIEQRFTTAKQDVKTIERQLSDAIISQKDITVTEHAQLRYCERVLGINLEEIKEKILPPSIREQVKTVGDGIFPIQNSHRVRVRNGVVITVLT